MQAIFAGIAILFLGWVAFTSVNVIFKDRILAAKERHFDEMQSFYEGRIADLQLSYDELNSQLVVAQDASVPLPMPSKPSSRSWRHSSRARRSFALR
jgi:hypothetical protein